MHESEGGEAPAAAARVLIIGSVTRDLVRRRGRAAAQIGGTVWFAGSTLAALGVRVTVLTRLAAADGRMSEALSAAGVALHALPSSVTTEFENIYSTGGHDDRRQEVGALAAPIESEALDALFERVDVVYLGALHPDDVAPAVLERLLSRPRPQLAMDVQGFTRRIVGRRVQVQVAAVLPRLLARARTVKASRHEAALITGAAAPDAAARRLETMQGGGEVLVTCGADGVLLAAGGRLHRRPAAIQDGADPTGAGDVLLASYLARRLGGEAPRPALAFAVAHTARRLADPARIVPLDG